MRVGINAEPLFQRVPTGAGVYTLGLLHGLASMDHTDSVGLFHADHPLIPADVAELPMERHAFELERDALYRSWAQTRRPAPQAVCGALDVVHGTGATLPPGGGAMVVATVHDVAALRFPDRYPTSMQLALRRSLQRAAREADLIICPSRSTAADLDTFLGVSGERLRIVPNGVDISSPDPERARDFIAHRGITEPYVLWVGTQEQRKNVGAVIEAFASLSAREPELTLVLHGPAGWLGEPVADAIRERKLEPRTRVSEGTLTRDELSSLYAHAAVFVFPSLYEGFGLPVLEAMACGTPVVASDRSAIPDSAGDAAVLVDPADTQALACAVEALLDDDDSRADLVERGRARAAGFTWERTALRTWSVYEELA